MVSVLAGTRGLRKESREGSRLVEFGNDDVLYGRQPVSFLVSSYSSWKSGVVDVHWCISLLVSNVSWVSCR
jgi:hypothetical protein